MLAVLGLLAAATEVAAEPDGGVSSFLPRSILLPIVSPGQSAAKPSYAGPLPRPQAGAQDYVGCLAIERSRTGNREFRYERRYDHAGRQVSQRSFSDTGTESEKRWLYGEQLDTFGAPVQLLLRVETDDGNRDDGFVDRHDEYSYVYARLTRVDHYTRDAHSYSEHTYTKNGGILTRRVKNYGADGDVASIEEFDTLNGIDVEHRIGNKSGTWTSRERWYHNAAGLLERLVTVDASGLRESTVSAFEYDRYGRLTYRGDYNEPHISPEPSHTWLWSYGPDGWPQSKVGYRRGLQDSSERYMWDDLGRPLSVSTESRLNSSRTTFEYHCP